MTIAILGATGGIGREIALALAGSGVPLALIGRSARDLESLAATIRQRHGAAVDVVHYDAEGLVSLATALAESPVRIQEIETLYCPIGRSRADDDGLLGAEGVRSLFAVNVLAVQAAAADIVPHMIAAGRGRIVAFSSVAAARGRRANAGYAAAKRALESYCESLRHRCDGTGVDILVVRLGYVATAQASARAGLFPAASPDRTARAVIALAGRRGGLVTYPGYWRLVLPLVSMMPWAVFRRLRF